MKKMLTLRNILLFGGALLGVVAFFVAFAAGFKGTMSIPLVGSYEVEMQGLIIGKAVEISGGTKEVGEAPFHAGLSLAGIIMMLVAGLAAVLVAVLVKKPWAKWVVLGCGVVILVGAIFVFCLKSSYVNSSIDYEIKESGVTPSPEERKQAYDMAMEMLKGMNLNAGAVITGVLGVLAAGAVGASQFVPEK